MDPNPRMMALPPDKLDPAAHTDAAELKAWLVQYGPALRQYFRRRAGAAEAEDLVQEVFAKLLARTEGQAIENVERYLFRVANNVLISRHRHDTTQVWKIDEDSVDALERTEDISPERVLIGKQTLVALAVAIAELPPVTREIFADAHQRQDGARQCLSTTSCPKRSTPPPPVGSPASGRGR